MMEYINIVVNEESLVINKSNNLIGEIYFNMGDKYFPEKGWTDFTVILLTWWIDIITQVCVSKKGEIAKLRFMEGPHYIRMFKMTENIVNLEFIKEGVKRDEVLFDAECDIVQIKNSLSTASNRVLRKIEKMKWDTSDTKRLKVLSDGIYN